jgi:hypothetical protein
VEYGIYRVGTGKWRGSGSRVLFKGRLKSIAHARQTGAHFVGYSLSIRLHGKPQFFELPLNRPLAAREIGGP